ncbi:DUF1707 and DUF2154 domain-containing protein [Actinomadura craniellae]|uniref:DUF1707 and DUF2154 domain-containing protein n=1 Tax=Actinomadura craniellae TaxID=2231787 RepID=A0A365GXZ4_9ACTN|nr:DUF1707 and DUF2154 domain-containing protein [Actinomadura craniellae]
MRASDAEREATVERLRVASVEGRLTLGELTERTEAAYAAATRGELARITADLPQLKEAPPEFAPAQRHYRFTAVLGDTKERVVGRVEAEFEALSVLGDVVLDLRDAQVPTGEVQITATSVLGNVKIVVPDGVEVRLTGSALLGDRRVRTRRVPPGRTVPVVHVHATAVLGDVEIVDDEHHERGRRILAAWWRSRTGRPAGPPRG